MKYNKLIVKNADQLIFGKAPFPIVTARGLEIGGGHVYPELNFTVPSCQEISNNNIPELKNMYSKIVQNALQRAVALQSTGLVIEFETLVEMTSHPNIGVELVKSMNEICEDFFANHGLKTEIRLTPNDIREFDRPPLYRTSKYLDSMLKLFDEGSKAGSDLLSIESTGGKEVCDDALMMCDIKSVVFSLAVLGVRDMKFLWEKIVNIANANGKIAAGDTACGFGNTAMVLAEQKHIPKVFAAIVRVATVVRSLVAMEQGAVGPHKDCGYEGVYIKAITGIPISLEGKTAACAHFSTIGNIASAAADLWSNESVQNIKLLSGMAPTVSYEQLQYDVRLMNAAIDKNDNSALTLHNLLIESDVHLDSQAFVLDPKNVIPISEEIVKGKNYVDATVRGCIKALELIKVAVDDNTLVFPENEKRWLDIIQEGLESIPRDESKFIEEMLPVIDTVKIILSEYGL